MALTTATEVMTFIKKKEAEAEAFYREMAQRFEEERDLFLETAKENKKYVKQIERAYYSVITDAMEGGFAFTLEPEEYGLDTHLSQEMSRKEGIERALKIEETILSLYEEGARQSKSLMADLPRAFGLVGKKRERRISKLKGLLEEKGSS